MTEQLTPYTPTTEHQGETPKQQERPWEDVKINGEDFKVKRGFTVLREIKGEYIPFTVDEYDQLSNGNQVLVWKLGMNQPNKRPAITRIDYGCPCMSEGNIPGHDCQKQRDLAFEAIKEAGIGAIATINERTAAGNGHGTHMVLEQADRQAKAILEGQPVPSMQQVYTELGHYDDIREHGINAGVLRNSIGSDRNIIPITSNADKFAVLQNAGFTIQDNLRLELKAAHTGISQDLVSRRRTGNYVPEVNGMKPGIYLVEQPNALTPARHTLFTRALYERRFGTQPSEHPVRDRMLAPLRRLKPRFLN